MTGLRRWFHGTFHAVHHSRNFRLFFLGQAVSVTGTWVQQVAFAWLVLRLTGSGVALGVVTALTFTPVLVLGAWGGVLADRYDKRRILLATQAAFAALALALWALVAGDVVRLWMVYGLALLQGVVTAVDTPARQSFFAEMVGAEHLTNAVSLNSAVMTGTRIVGPAVAGLLIAGVGLAACFLVNGVSYLAVIGGLLAMRPEELHRPPVPKDGGRLRAGLRYVWIMPELRTPLLVMAAVFTLSFNFQVLMPLVAERSFHGDARTLGWLLSSAGIGSLVGALLMARRARPDPARLMRAAVAFGALSALAAAMPSLWAVYAALVAVGFASIVFMITGNTTLQLTSRPDVRGRVMALYSVVFLGGTPIGALVAGWTAEAFGPRWAFALGGLMAGGAGLAGRWSLRRRTAGSVELEAAPARAA